MLRRLLVLVLFIAMSATVTGCARDSAMTLAQWRLDLSASGGASDTLVTIPTHLDTQIPSTTKTFALRSHVTLPAEMRGQTLTFAIPMFMARCHLWVNTHEMTPLDVEEGYRGSHHPRFRIPSTVSGVETLDLELRVENRWTQSSWIDIPPRLSATDAGDATYLRIRRFNVASALGALATALFVFFAYVIVFLLDRTKRAYGWFAAEALLGAVYPAFQLGLMTPYIGFYDGPIMTTSVTTALVASMHFVHAQFGLSRPHRAWNIPVIVCALAAYVFAGPFELTHLVAPVTVFTIFCNIAYQLMITGRELRRGERPVHAVLMTLSWAGLGIFGFVDFYAWVGGGELLGGYRGACLGILGIATLHSAVLSFDHFEALRRSDALNVELAGRVALTEAKNAEVVVLNAELRRQIAARSEQLSAVLSRSGETFAVTTRSLASGEVVDGRYRVVGRVGEGGMGTVYEVSRISDGQQFALKLLTQARDHSEMARFAREAHIVAQISHPHVVSIVDVEIATSGAFYIVMEFVSGLSLRYHADHFKDKTWALEVLRQMADGLAAVHARGIVHRDLKPGNVLVTTDDARKPTVKIADFGISSAPAHEDSEMAMASFRPTAPEVPAARRLSSAPPPPPPFEESGARHAHGAIDAIDAVTNRDTDDLDNGDDDTVDGVHRIPVDGPYPLANDGHLTQTGVLMGTPRYMAPELGAGAKLARPSSDMFSLGVIAYEILTGTTPFREAPAVLRMQGLSYPPPTPLSAACPGIDPALAALFERCLLKEPSDRPRARELAEAIAFPHRRSMSAR